MLQPAGVKSIFAEPTKVLVYGAPCKVFFGKKGQDIMGPPRAAEKGKMRIAVGLDMMPPKKRERSCEFLLIGYGPGI
jgi:hypothetical protein